MSSPHPPQSSPPVRPRRFYASLPAMCQISSLTARRITVETMIRRGLPNFQISGLGGARESAERIRSALQSCNERAPGAHIQVNLAPVDLPKTGAELDLSIAVSVLLAMGQPHMDSALFELCTARPARNHATLFLGELALDGSLRPVKALLNLLARARQLGFARVVIPAAQTSLACLVPDLEIIPLRTLGELLQAVPPPEPGTQKQTRCHQLRGHTPPLSPLFSELQLDPRATRALAIAAAGWHPMLLIGPPGTGKSILARETLALLAPPAPQECLEILAIDEQKRAQLEEDLAKETTNETRHSTTAFCVERPLRSPHHSCTRAALIGGGQPPTPGEITRAHHGILLLDELAEFSRDALQALREPLENHHIDLSRGRESIRLPCRFLLIATTNPCPCGRHLHGQCTCSRAAIRSYMNRILGPLRDRIDLEVRVDRISAGDVAPRVDELRAAVMTAGQRQHERFAGTTIRFNGEIPAADLDELAPLALPEARQEWSEFVESRRFSRRSLAGIRRLARTIADLESAAEIRSVDLQEALYYRCLDQYWSA